MYMLAACRTDLVAFQQKGIQTLHADDASMMPTTSMDECDNAVILESLPVASAAMFKEATIR